ncbi:MAG: RNA-binding domain-containing protein [Formosimonas sp.]
MQLQPLTDEQLRAMLTDLESDCIERKRNYKNETIDKVHQAICAFANDLPNNQKQGVVLIGIEDNGDFSDFEITEKLINQIADIKTNGKILPMPAMTVTKHTLGGHDFIVVMVLPADAPPVKYDGRIWIRTGARRAQANAQEERILNERRRYKNLPFDLHSMEPATNDDLSKSIFENDYLPQAFAADVLEANGRTFEERLASCRFVNTEMTAPTVTGLLAVGISPRDFLSGAYIQFLRIEGTELSDDVSDAEEVDGCLLNMLRRIDDKLRSHNRESIDITSAATHIKSIAYPQAALQQIIYNAVLHRTYESTNAPVRVYWYNDRIEVHSPGGPYGNVTKDNFAKPGITDYRNPHIADVLKTYGFIQAFGRGIATAKHLMLENGNPDLEFEVNDSTVVCIFRKKANL